MGVHNLHGMTLADAAALLESLRYEHTMDFPDVRAIVDRFSDADRQRIVLALNVSAVAYQMEAEALEREADRRGGNAA